VQPNGVTGGRAVRIAMQEPHRALDHFAAMGLRASPGRTCPRLGALAHEIPVAPGQSLLILEADGPGPTREFIATRADAGVMGVSLLVESQAAISARAAALELAPDWHPGLFGDSLIVPGSHAMGLYLEFIRPASSH